MSGPERELDQIWDRLDKLEAKVDKLLDFRGWVLGALAGISALVSVVVTLIAAKLGSK